MIQPTLLKVYSPWYEGSSIKGGNNEAKSSVQHEPYSNSMVKKNNEAVSYSTLFVCQYDTPLVQHIPSYI